MIEVFTDGACSGNPGPGGWGWAIANSAYGSGSELQSTNQRMEVWAVLDALQTMLAQSDDETIEIVSDSTYVVNCFRDSWWKGWESRGWKNSQKQPVANQDLWKPLIALYKENSARIRFRWVKGHSGNTMNDRVDQLAVAAAQSQSARRIVGLSEAALSEAAPSNAALSEAANHARPIIPVEPVGPAEKNEPEPLTLF
jgi:ribonuclease HI